MSSSPAIVVIWLGVSQVIVVCMCVCLCVCVCVLISGTKTGFSPCAANTPRFDRSKKDVDSRLELFSDNRIMLLDNFIISTTLSVSLSLSLCF